MKRLLVFVLPILIITILYGLAHSAVNGGAITTEVRTNTSVLIKVTTKASTLDSLYICRMYSGSSDTAFLALIDSTLVNKLLGSQEPGRQSIFFLLARDANGRTAISDKDTVTFYGSEIESSPTTKDLYKMERVISATSWRPADTTYTFTISGETDDSTGVYIPWKDNSIFVTASQPNDSAKAMLYVVYGNREMTQKGSTYGYIVAKDSLNITGAGNFIKTLTASTAYPSMYFRLEGYKGNGKATTVSIYLTRSRY